MRSFVLGCVSVVAVALSPVAQAAGFELEGAYKFTSRGDCEADESDTLVLYSGPEGELHAALSSAEWTIVYQQHVLTWDGADTLSGYTQAGGFLDGTFTATVSTDRKVINGSVDTTACDTVWNFSAERVDVADGPFTLTPLATTPTFADFAGTFAASTHHTDGTLRIQQLPDGRVVANFGNATAARIVNFEKGALDTANGVLEFFSFDRGEPHLKWVLQYGYAEGRLALQGYGLSRWGRIYPVSAAQ